MSSNAEHFFQTTSSIEEIERRKRKASNSQGNPIKLPTKLLAVEVNYAFDPSGGVVFVAEAGGTVSGVRVSTGEVSRTGKGSSAPLASLAHYCAKIGPADPFQTLYIYAGGWDKSITGYVFNIAPQTDQGRTVTEQVTFKAHNDFVKCLLIAQTADDHPILVSGGSDGDINFWTLPDHRRLATVKPQARGIECFALDPYSDPAAPTIFISTSQREIFTLAIPALSDITTSTMQPSLSAPLIIHETSVYTLHFDANGDLWTASADKTAKHLVRVQNWQPDTVLTHPDFVRAVVTTDRHVITGCRDEEIRLWDAASGDLLHVFSGHFDEVTGLAVTGAGNALTLVSISIDATLRRWSLAPRDIQEAIERTKKPDLLAENPEPEGLRTEEVDMLTEEEEAELRALMEEEEADTMEQMASGLQ